ncbi:hypothetical protein [Reichenbachiella versicolor]|uniref:hypothetical protein n=1 Tax=Reichenbachiella versicolor TaxID=1821036 RepID=UPI000D6E89F3|nr:hypothetical protein [Reichenbachiella versicolor]
MNFEKYFLIGVLMLTSTKLFSQHDSGYYMDWNTDHTQRTIKPSIKLTEKEAQSINCYKVTFDEQGRLQRVEYFVSGKKSSNASYGAHMMEVKYFSDHKEESFRNTENKRVSNQNGIWLCKYSLNEEGYWTRKENHGKKGNLKEQYGVAVWKVYRDYQNRRLSEIRFNSSLDTIPDPNGFKVTHFTYNEDGFITSRQNRDQRGELQNGKYGYAKVVFHMNQDGQFYGEEFLDSKSKLVNSTSLGYAKIDMRDFNKYGKNRRFYFTDESGYPSKEKAMGVVTYHENMAKDEVVYYDRNGNQTKDPKVRAKSKYIYDENGEYIKRINYNYEGEVIQ